MIINFIKIDTLEKAKNVPCIFNNWANFYKGEFISNTILNAKSFEKLMTKIKGSDFLERKEIWGDMQREINSLRIDEQENEFI